MSQKLAIIECEVLEERPKARLIRGKTPQGEDVEDWLPESQLIHASHQRGQPSRLTVTLWIAEQKPFDYEEVDE